MKGRYDDIVSRVADPILWYDEHGVPRYVPFASLRKADIPANEAALVEVVCQRCLRGVLVCCSGVQRRDGSRRLVVEAIRADAWGLYGDPPCHTTEAERVTGMDGSSAGESKVSIGVRVVDTGTARMENGRVILRSKSPSATKRRSYAASPKESGRLPTST